MKSIFKILLGLAIAILPLAVYAAAQEPEQDKDKPKQEEPKKQTPPQQKQEPKEKTKTEKQEPAPKEQKDQQKAEQKQQEQNQKEQQKQAKQDEKKPKDQNQQPAQTQQQNARAQQSTPSSGKGQRIPEQKFQAHFGREHHFHVGHLDDGHRFQYGGYWFEVTQVWPAGWSYDDDCYIEEDDDTYYLVDLYHPDVRLVVIVIAV